MFINIIRTIAISHIHCVYAVYSVPNKLHIYVLVNFVTVFKEKLHVKCSQTNKKFKVDITTLSRDDGEP